METVTLSIPKLAPPPSLLVHQWHRHLPNQPSPNADTILGQSLSFTNLHGPIQLSAY